MTDAEFPTGAIAHPPHDSRSATSIPDSHGFHDVARLAAQICHVPVGLIALVSEPSPFITGDITQSSQNRTTIESLVAATLRGTEPLIVADTAADARLSVPVPSDDDSSVRFFAGVPLTDSDGERIGVLGVMDLIPAALTEAQTRALSLLGAQVASVLEAKRIEKRAARRSQELLESERTLRGREQFLTRLLEGSQDCIKVLDLDGRLLMMNEGGMRVMDICDFAPLRNQPWHSLWPTETQETVRAAIATARAGGVARFAGFCPTASGAPRWWDVAVNAIVDADGQPEQLLAVSRDITDRHRAEDLLRALTEGTAAATGAAFFASLVQHLARALGVWRVFLAECLDSEHARARAVWMGDSHAPLFEYPLTGTPCAKVVEGETCLWARDIQRAFPDNQFMKQVGLESYLGVPMFNSDRCVIGHMVVTDRKPMPEDPLWISVLQTFAARAGAGRIGIAGHEPVVGIRSGDTEFDD
mgnify:CR=1 FL=1